MNKKIIGIIVCLMFISGCSIFRSNNEHLERDLSESTKIVNVSADNILSSAKKIDKEVISIKQSANTIRTPEQSEIVENITESAENITAESGKLKEVSSALSKTGVKLEISGRTVDDYVSRTIDAEKHNAKLTNENIQLKEDVKTGMGKMLKWIVGGCLIGAGACAAMVIFFGNFRGGVAGASACLIIMTLALAVGQYMAYIAIAGVVVIVGSLGLLVYQLFIQRRAIFDNIWTQEIVKKQLPITLKEKIYGGNEDAGQAGIIQSASTQKIVKNIKRKLPRGWTVIKEDSNFSNKEKD